jgi:hypothetical protein
MHRQEDGPLARERSGLFVFHWWGALIDGSEISRWVDSSDYPGQA